MRGVWESPYRFRRCCEEHFRGLLPHCRFRGWSYLASIRGNIYIDKISLQLQITLRDGGPWYKSARGFVDKIKMREIRSFYSPEALVFGDAKVKCEEWKDGVFRGGELAKTVGWINPSLWDFSERRDCLSIDMRIQFHLYAKDNPIYFKINLNSSYISLRLNPFLVKLFPFSPQLFLGFCCNGSLFETVFARNATLL